MLQVFFATIEKNCSRSLHLIYNSKYKLYMWTYRLWQKSRLIKLVNKGLLGQTFSRIDVVPLLWVTAPCRLILWDHRGLKRHGLQTKLRLFLFSFCFFFIVYCFFGLVFSSHFAFISQKELNVNDEKYIIWFVDSCSEKWLSKNLLDNDLYRFLDLLEYILFGKISKINYNLSSPILFNSYFLAWFWKKIELFRERTTFTILIFNTL